LRKPTKQGILQITSIIVNVKNLILDLDTIVALVVVGNERRFTESTRGNQTSPRCPSGKLS